MDSWDTREERARAAARVVADAVNEMSFDVEAFADELLRQHRTIQQNVFRTFLGTIKAWSGLTPNQCDERNEYTVRTSKQIAELLGEYGMKPPFI